MTFKEIIDEAAKKVLGDRLNRENLPAPHFPLSDTENGFEQWISYCKGVLYLADPKDRYECLSAFERNIWRAFAMQKGDGKFIRVEWKDLEPHRDRAFSDVVSWMRKEHLDFDATKMYQDFLRHTPSGSSKLNSLIDSLQQNGFLPDKTTPHMHSLWRGIVEGGHKTTAQLLLQKGYAPEWQPLIDAKALGCSFVSQIGREESDTFLHLVKTKASFDVIKIFDRNSLRPFVHVINSKGETVLHSAARDLLSDYVEFLIGLGADRLLKNKKGQTPFDCIKRTKSRPKDLQKIVGLLGGSSEKTPDELFGQALKSLDCSMFRLGVQKGGDLTAFVKKDTLGFFGALFPEIPVTRLNKTRKLQEEIAVYFLNLGIFDLSDKQNQNALHYACRNGAVGVAALVLEKHPSFALQKSVAGKTPAALKMTLIHKTPPNLNLYDQNVFRQILAKNQQDIAKIYIKNGVTINDGDFPNINDTKETKTWLQKALLKQAVADKKISAVSGEKRKM